MFAFTERYCGLCNGAARVHAVAQKIAMRLHVSTASTVSTNTTNRMEYHRQL